MSLFEDTRGSLWFGTDGSGVSRYDGRKFTNYGLESGLVNSTVRSIIETRDAKILFGTTQGISSYDGYRFQTLIPDINCNALWEFEDKKLLIGTSSGLLIYYNSSIQSPEWATGLKGRSINALMGTENGLLIGTDDGLFMLREGQLSTLDLQGLEEGPIITALAGKSDDLIWICTDGEGLFRWFRGEVKKVNQVNQERIISAASIDDEKVAIATINNGLIIYNYIYDQLDYYTERNGLANDRLKSVIKDRWGNIWAASLGNGVSRLTEEPFQKLGRNKGLPENTVRSITVDRKGHIWFSHSLNMLGKYDGTNFFNFDQSLDFPSVRVSKILEDGNGRLWIGTERNGLLLKNDEGFQNFPLPVDMRSISDIELDKNGSLWISSTDKGLLQMTFIKTPVPIFRHFSKDSLLSSNSIIDLQADQKGGIWVLQKDRGIVYIDAEGLFKTIRVDDGLLNQNIQSITLDAFGCLWANYVTDGLSSILIEDETTVIRHYVEEGSIPNLSVSKVQAFRDQLALVHKEGVDWFESNASCQISFLERSKFKTGQIDLASSIHAKASNDNDIFLGTRGGIVKIRREAENSIQTPSVVVFSRIAVNSLDLSNHPEAYKMSNWYQSNDVIQLSPKENNVEFEFFSNQKPGTTSTYQWQLDGYDKNWSMESMNTSVSYPMLRPGDYTFKVRANNGNVEGELTTFSFSIAKPVIQTFWFRLLIGLLAISTIFALYHWRLRSIKNKIRRQQQELESELSVLGLEQKALQLQMNPHFIFNSLNAIQALIVKKDLDLARTHLNQFSSLMRSFLQHSRSESISLREEVEMLEKYLAIENMTRGNKFDYRVELENDEMDDIHIPPMMTQVFVENAIIHGINHLKGRGFIRVRFEEIGNKIKCTIDDNGIGREASKDKKSTIHESTAIKVIRERLEILHRNSSLEVFKIKDKYDQNGKASGTMVEIILPILN